MSKFILVRDSLKQLGGVAILFANRTLAIEKMSIQLDAERDIYSVGRHIAEARHSKQLTVSTAEALISPVLTRGRLSGSSGAQSRFSKRLK